MLVQSFETGNLRELAGMTPVPLVQLLDVAGAPYDLVAAGDTRTYDALATPAGLAGVAEYAAAVGAHKDRVLPRDPRSGDLGSRSTLVADAHAAGLLVHVWTLRDENQFLAARFRNGSDPRTRGDAHAEAQAFLEAGVDGIFTDHPDTTGQAVEDWLAVSHASA